VGCARGRELAAACRNPRPHSLRTPSAKAIAERTIQFFKGAVDNYKEEIASFGSAPTMYAGLVDAKGNLQLYDGGLRFRSAAGEIIEDQIAAEDYANWIGETSLRESYLKAPYFKPKGPVGGVYRVAHWRGSMLPIAAAFQKPTLS